MPPAVYGLAIPTLPSDWRRVSPRVIRRGAATEVSSNQSIVDSGLIGAQNHGFVNMLIVRDPDDPIRVEAKTCSGFFTATGEIIILATSPFSSVTQQGTPYAIVDVGVGRSTPLQWVLSFVLQPLVSNDYAAGPFNAITANWSAGLTEIWDGMVNGFNSTARQWTTPISIYGLSGMYLDISEFTNGSVLTVAVRIYTASMGVAGPSLPREYRLQRTKDAVNTLWPLFGSEFPFFDPIDPASVLLGSNNVADDGRTLRLTAFGRRF